MILDTRPCLLERVVTSDAGWDDNGDWREGVSTYICPARCDAVPAGEGQTLAYEDGTRVAYSYTVYLSPYHCHAYKIGERVRLTLRDGSRRLLTVKGYHAYQLQKKLWL